MTDDCLQMRSDGRIGGLSEVEELDSELCRPFER